MYREPYRYRGYDIQFIENPPVWQAAIYPTEEQLSRIDWAASPISASDAQATLEKARRRIDFALAGLREREPRGFRLGNNGAEDLGPRLGALRGAGRSNSSESSLCNWLILGP
jgi:hypothetical protein